MARNPDLFRRMAEPFPDVEAANAAIAAFWKAVEGLREQHKITNVYVIISTPYVGTDGEEVDAALTGMLGDSNKAESMTAFAFGYEQNKRQEFIGKLLAGNVKKLKSKS